uniref:SH2 domain-containing protein n=1 Tax=Rhabditophanes sp. KR3021 TaxID=114890 RepID=A0AC35TSQ1_9BILA
MTLNNTTSFCVVFSYANYFHGVPYIIRPRPRSTVTSSTSNMSYNRVAKKTFRRKDSGYANLDDGNEPCTLAISLHKDEVTMTDVSQIENTGCSSQSSSEISTHSCSNDDSASASLASLYSPQSGDIYNEWNKEVLRSVNKICKTVYRMNYLGVAMKSVAERRTPECNIFNIYVRLVSELEYLPEHNECWIGLFVVYKQKNGKYLHIGIHDRINKDTAEKECALGNFDAPYEIFKNYEEVLDHFKCLTKLRPSIILGKYGNHLDKPYPPKFKKIKFSPDPIFKNYYVGVKRRTESEIYVPKMLQFALYHQMFEERQQFENLGELIPLFIVYHSHSGRRIHIPIAQRNNSKGEVVYFTYKFDSFNPRFNSLDELVQQCYKQVSAFKEIAANLSLNIRSKSLKKYRCATTFTN